jgi:cytochrome c oxidase subunit 2
MKTLLKLVAVVAAFGLGPAAATAQQTQGTAAEAATGNQSQERVAPAAAQTATPSPAVTGQPSGAATASTANAPSAEVTDVPVYSTPLSARENVGAPDGRMGIQDQVTPIGREAAGFHDWILMPAITIITLIVLFLMLYVILRYRRAAHPVPSRTTHNTTVEVLWTLIPVLILVVIAVPSIRLLAHQYSPPAADVTVKVIGNQWFWTYEYPDHGIELTSNMLAEQSAAQPGRSSAPMRWSQAPGGGRAHGGAARRDREADRDLRGRDPRLRCPAFWVKMDAVPAASTRPGSRPSSRHLFRPML